MKISIRKILSYIVVFALFSDALSYTRLSFAEIKIYYFIIPVILMLFFIALKGLYFNVKFICVISVIFLSSYINVLFGNNTLPLLLKQLVGILITSTFFYLLLKINNYDVPRVFKIYLNLAFVVALIGLIQEASYLLGFKPGYDYSRVLTFWHYYARVGSPFIRVNSILPEPTHFCNIMTPALFVSMASLSNRSLKLQNNWKSVVIIIAFLLTFSTTGYIVAGFSIMLLLYNYRKANYILLVGLLILLISSLVYVNIYEVRLRCKHTIGILTGKAKLEEVNLSTYALASNAFISLNSFSRSPIFGSGLGSHQVSYDKYITKYVSRETRAYRDYSVNRQDAASLFLRLLSETGLFGLTVFMIFILKHHVIKRDDKDNVLWIINNAIMAYFAIKLMRNGHYFNEGFFLFVWMYYFSKIQVNLKSKEIASKGFACQRKQS